MADPTLVLVDTSVWIQFFRRGRSVEAAQLDALLDQEQVATCAPIRAEVLSGTRTRQDFERMRRLFAALVMLSWSEHLWDALEEHRFVLARQGRQVALVDLMIVLTAQMHGATLWTLDRDFATIASVVPVKMEH